MKSLEDYVISKRWVLADESGEISIGVSEKLGGLEEFVLKLMEGLSTGIRNASGFIEL